MNTVAWMLALLVALLAVAAVVVAAGVARPWPDCINQVVTTQGRDGAPIECVCLAGSLATCFDPTPTAGPW